MLDLFNKKDKAAAAETKTETPGAPDIKQESIRSMAGFGSLDEIAQSGADIVKGAAAARDAKRRAPKLTKADQEAAEAAAKAEKKAKAMETLGKFFCKELTAVPYDVWAWWLKQEELKLSKEEHEKLTEALFLTVQGFEVDMSSPWVALGGFGLLNVAIVGKRVKTLQDAAREAAEAAANAAPERGEDERLM